jgi:hypothetical protein
MKGFNWIIALIGLWEFGDVAALFVPGFGHIQAFVWSHILTGFILVIAGAWAALTSRISTARTLDWIAAAAGGWLMIGPLVLGPPAMAAGLWNDLIAGAIVLVLGAWAALAAPRGAG